MTISTGKEMYTGKRQESNGQRRKWRISIFGSRGVGEVKDGGGVDCENAAGTSGVPCCEWDFYRTEKEVQKSRRRTTEWTLPVLRRFFPSGQGVRVLCLGCGYGIDVVVLREHGYDCFGADVDPNCCEGARSVFVQADALCLPFEAASFDALISLEVIEHIAGPSGDWKPLPNSVAKKERFAAEATRVVRPGGIIVIATPNRLFPFDEHGGGKSQLRWHLPFKDLTLSYSELKGLFERDSSETGILPYGRYFALEKIERLLGRRCTRFLESFFPLLSWPIIHMSPLNPHLFLYFRRKGFTVDRRI